jgi:hypothetical protein
MHIMATVSRCVLLPSRHVAGLFLIIVGLLVLLLCKQTLSLLVLATKSRAV